MRLAVFTVSPRLLIVFPKINKIYSSALISDYVGAEANLRFANVKNKSEETERATFAEKATAAERGKNKSGNKASSDSLGMGNYGPQKPGNESGCGRN